MRNPLTITILVAAAGMLTLTAAAASARETPAAPEASQRGATPAATSPAPQPADANRQICVDEQLSGSHITRRICRTAREWQARGEGDRL